MFASQGKKLINNPEVLLELLLPVILFFIINFILGQIIGRLLRFKDKNIISLNLTTLARNSPVALAIAVTAFPINQLLKRVILL